MNYKPLRIALGIFIITVCLGQTPDAENHTKQLAEHWLWKNYWEGGTELGTSYKAGREFHALLWWRINDMPPSVGFCSADLGVCQYYQDTSQIGASSETKILPGEDSKSAFNRFLANSFGRNAFSLDRSAPPKRVEYTTEMVKIVLPGLDPPEAIRDRRMQPRAEVDALVASLGCLPDQTGCKTVLLIPFYGSHDPWVPIFRQCSGCPNPKPMIIFMKLIDGKWWHGAQDFDGDPDSVERTRNQIQRALMDRR